MLLDFVLASLHHLAVFGLFGVFLVELALLRPGMGRDTLVKLARYDLAYGILAGLVIAIGILRLVFGLKGLDYYAANHAFWGKMLAFGVVGALSVPPSLSFARWRKALAGDPAFVPPDAQVRSVRRIMMAEALFFAAIPVFAAAMARNIG